MKLDAGEVIDWPLHPFVCDGSDIFTIVNGTSVFRLKEDLLLPGFAEEVGKVIPEIVEWSADPQYANTMDYTRIISFLVEAVKEQQKKIVV